MKINKVCVLGLLLFPVLLSAQENEKSVSASDINQQVQNKVSTKEAWLQGIIRSVCPSLSEKQLSTVAASIDKRITTSRLDFPTDICCDAKTVFAHQWGEGIGSGTSEGESVGWDWYDAYDINTGELSRNLGANARGAAACKEGPKPKPVESPLARWISEKCPNITEKQIKKVEKNISARNVGLTDIGCNSQVIYGLYVSPQFDDGIHWCLWDVKVWERSTGEYLGVARMGQIETTVIKTLSELEKHAAYSPKTICVGYDSYEAKKRIEHCGN